jgi:hypothetical protein
MSEHSVRLIKKKSVELQNQGICLELGAFHSGHIAFSSMDIKK